MQGGVAEIQRTTFSQVFQALALSVLLIYMLLVALFENMLSPLVVLLSLPVSVVGAVGLLALTGNSLNTLSLIGMILLTGLVGKNAILLVDFTNSLRQRGLARDAALLAAGPTRLRPILMTTCALVVAMLPTALRVGAGSEWRAPMAVTVIGGLITSTLLTLVMVPSVYTILDDLCVRLAQLRPTPLALPARVAHPLRPFAGVPLPRRRRVAAAARDYARSSAGRAQQVHRRSGG
jgi:HAE1 family hydrophobic/amphiphilic exporter-1